MMFDGCYSQLAARCRARHLSVPNNRSSLRDILSQVFRRASRSEPGGRGRPGSLAISPADVLQFYKKLQELARKAEVERQKQLEATKQETKEYFERFFRVRSRSQSKDLEITKRDFLALLEDKKNFSIHCFRLFDTDNSGYVSTEEVQEALNKLNSHGEASKKTKKWFIARLRKFTSGDVDQEAFNRAINPNFLSKFFDLLDIDGSGTVTLEEMKRSIDRLLLMGAEEKVLAYLETMFHERAKDTENINYDEFKTVVRCKQEYFTQRMFEICDKDKSKSISLVEFTSTLGRLMKTSDNEEEKKRIMRDKLMFLFSIYDKDSSGDISRAEMLKCIEECTKESSLDLKDVELLSNTLFDKADTDNSNTITFDEFFEVLEPFTNNIEINPKGWVLPQKKKGFVSVQRENLSKYFSGKYIRNNIVLIGNVIVLALLYIIIFAVGMWMYRDTYLALMIAKGAGKCINLTSALLFVSMCRFTLTIIRNTWLGRKFLALDMIVDIHKALGIIYAVMVLIHSVAHIFTFMNYGKALGGYEFAYKKVENASVAIPGSTWVGYPYISGTIMDVILLVLLPYTYVRKRGKFTEFYIAHLVTTYLLGIAVILHCLNGWKWMCVPLAVYALEQIANTSIISKRKFKIINYRLLPSDVIELHIKRPVTFNFNAGSYAFLRIPYLTRFEKHPFTISSSTEDREMITFHIKKCRGWTRQLHEVLTEDNKAAKAALDEARSHRDNGEVAVRVINSLKQMKDDPYSKNFGMLTSRDRTVYVDGPYGTPATEIFKSEHAILVAAGIGVTPFASILQTIIDKYDEDTVVCNNCQHITYLNKWKIGIKKLDFVWITRDQRSLQWFIQLLQRLETVVDRIEEAKQNQHLHELEEKTTATPNRLKGALSALATAKRRVSTSTTNGSTPVPETVPEEPSPESAPTEENHNGSAAVEQKPRERFLDIHIYLTSALSKKDFRAVGLQFALQLMREGSNVDHITGLRAQTNTGRPDFEELFNKIVKPDNRRKVTVFFCGSPVIEEVLKEQCTKRQFKFKAEKF